MCELVIVRALSWVCLSVCARARCCVTINEYFAVCDGIGVTVTVFMCMYQCV